MHLCAQFYEGMCHNLTAGETDENIEIIFNDAISWVYERSEDPVVNQSKKPVENGFKNPIEGLLDVFKPPSERRS